MYAYQQVLLEKNRIHEKVIAKSLEDLNDQKREVETLLKRLNRGTEELKIAQYLKDPDKTKIEKEEAEERKLKALISETDEKFRKIKEMNMDKKEVSKKMQHPTIESIKRKRDIKEQNMIKYTNAQEGRFGYNGFGYDNKWS